MAILFLYFVTGTGLVNSRSFSDGSHTASKGVLLSFRDAATAARRMAEDADAFGRAVGLGVIAMRGPSGAG